MNFYSELLCVKTKPAYGKKSLTTVEKISHSHCTEMHLSRLRSYRSDFHVIVCSRFYLILLLMSLSSITVIENVNTGVALTVNLTIGIYFFDQKLITTDDHPNLRNRTGGFQMIIR